MTSARALVLHGTPSAPDPRLDTVTLPAPGDGEVVVRVAASSLNYKDGLAVTGKGKIVRADFPFVPGIDLAGTVATSRDAAMPEGTPVVLTGWGTGESRWGGYATHAVARASHLVRLPDGLTPHDAMALGTAGLTAMLAVMALEAPGAVPGGLADVDGDVVVTGASGGVGSLAVHLLAQSGRRVVASSGKDPAYLARLGASEVIGREVLGGGTHRPMEAGRWSGAVDTVGGATLAGVLATTKTHGRVAACGNAQSADLATTVFPFILRGVSLLGIDSNTCPMPLREKAWARLARDVDRGVLAGLTTTIGLADVPAWAERITTSAVQGRVVVDLDA